LNVPSRSPFSEALQVCIGILRLRNGPEDLPASSLLLWAVLAGSVLLRLAMYSLPAPEPTPDQNLALIIALELGIHLACVMVALRAAGTPERFPQTVTALLGCQLVLAPALLGGRWLLINYYQSPGGMGALSQLIFVAISVWLLIVTVRILRSATEWPTFACVMLALGIEMLMTLGALMLYSPPPDAALAPA